MMTRNEIELLINVYSDAFTVPTKNGKFTTVNQLTDQLPALTPVVLAAAVNALIELGPINSDVILGEDDKGAILTAVVAFNLWKPLAMARKYPYEIPGSVRVSVDMEYDDFMTTVNGIKTGDRVTIIDDTLASGGTAEALARAVTSAGAHVDELRVVTEKLGYGGRERLADSGIKVASVLGIRVNDVGAISVETAFGVPL